MAQATDIAIVSGARTPMGRYCGKLRDFTAMDLAAVASQEAIRRSGVDPKEFDHAVFGNAQQTSGDSLYGARHVALKAGLPIETPALTVNRLCGSGMQSLVNAAQMIQLGEAGTVLAGGMESMSQAPHVVRGARWGLGLGEGKLEDSLMVALLDTYCGLYMANTAELYAEQQGITRQHMDEFSLQSQQKAGAAQKACRLAEEIVPVALKNRKGEPTGEMFEKDDHLRICSGPVCRRTHARIYEIQSANAGMLWCSKPWTTCASMWAEKTLPTVISIAALGCSAQPISCSARFWPGTWLWARSTPQAIGALGPVFFGLQTIFSAVLVIMTGWAAWLVAAHCS